MNSRPASDNQLYRINKQDGSLMLMTVMVMLVVTILGSSIVGIASMEGKMGAYNGRILQAQQAADSGIEISQVRIDQFLRSSSGTIPINEKSEKVYIISEGSPGVRCRVTIDDTNLNENGTVKIVSTGEVISDTGQVLSKKKVTAMVNYTGESRYSMRSKSIMVNGEPSLGFINDDRLNILGGDNIATSDYEANGLHSSSVNVENDYLPAVLTQSDVAKIAELIKLDALTANSKWNYMQPSFSGNRYNITASNLSVTRPYLYVDMNQDKLLNVDMGGNGIADRIVGTFVVGGNTLNSAIIVSPAAIEINFGVFNDRMPEGSYIFVMSPNDITINFNASFAGAYWGSDQVRLYTLSGNNLTLNADTNDVNISGSLNAANNITVNFRDDIWGLFAQQEVNLTPDPNIINAFPYNWAMVRVGAITAYTED